MTPLKTCQICSNATSRLYTAPGGAMVCQRCLAVPKALNLARIEGVPEETMQLILLAVAEAGETGVFRIPEAIYTPAVERFLTSFLGAIGERPGDCRDA